MDQRTKLFIDLHQVLKCSDGIIIGSRFFQHYHLSGTLLDLQQVYVLDLSSVCG